MAAIRDPHRKPRAIWRRKGNAVVAANEVAEAMLASLKEDVDYVGEIHGARSIKQLRLYWGGLMKILVDHDIFPSLVSASDSTKIAAGFIDEPLIMPDTGQVFLRPASIAIGSLPQHEFNEFLDKAIDVVVRRWLPGSTHEEIRREVFAVLDPPEKRALGERIAA